MDLEFQAGREESGVRKLAGKPGDMSYARGWIAFTASLDVSALILSRFSFVFVLVNNFCTIFYFWELFFCLLQERISMQLEREARGASMAHAVCTHTPVLYHT